MPGRCLSSVTCGDALRGEGDRSRNISCDIILQFQSTSSARRTTSIPCSASCIASNFNPRPPRGGRLGNAAKTDTPMLFQSTSSARRTTFAAAVCASVINISIHVLREEDDVSTMPSIFPCGYFNPRPPRGGRRVGGGVGSFPLVISIHILREEDDFCRCYGLEFDAVFQSTSSARRTTVRPRKTGCSAHISIHVLREEDDNTEDVGKLVNYLFQSTSSARRTTGKS